MLIIEIWKFQKEDFHCQLIIFEFISIIEINIYCIQPDKYALYLDIFPSQKDMM